MGSADAGVRETPAITPASPAAAMTRHACRRKFLVHVFTIGGKPKGPTRGASSNATMIKPFPAVEAVLERPPATCNSEPLDAGESSPKRTRITALRTTNPRNWG